MSKLLLPLTLIFFTGKLIFNFGLNSFSLGFKSSNNILVIDLSVLIFFDFDQKAEFGFKEQPKIKIKKNR